MIVFSEISSRLELIRSEIFGEADLDSLPTRLGIDPDAWSEIEKGGRAVPPSLLLAFVELTDADPIWLLSGIGRKYRSERPGVQEGSPARP